VKGGMTIAAEGKLSLSNCRFDALEIALPDSGATKGTLRGVSVAKTFRLSGDKTALSLEGCSLPK